MKILTINKLYMKKGIASYKGTARDITAYLEGRLSDPLEGPVEWETPEWGEDLIEFLTTDHDFQPYKDDR
jgi:hypothetical protein